MPYIIITGCAKGIGRGLTTYFIEQGHQVAGIDIDADEASSLQRSLQMPEKFTFHHGSVADEAFVRSVYSSLSESEVVGLVNNAGIANAYTAPIEELDLGTWNDYLATNLTGTMLNMKYAAPHLRKSKGSIVNITSTRAFQSEANSECYAATKGGIVALTHAAAISLGPDIRVNAIAPGWIDVSLHQGSKSDPYQYREQDLNQHPVGFVGNPDDIAHAVDYLLSDKSRFMTGQVLTLDGGMTRKMIYEH